MIVLQQIANKIINGKKYKRRNLSRQMRETHFGVASGGGGSVLRFLAPGFPVLGDRCLVGFACVIHD